MARSKALLSVLNLVDEEEVPVEQAFLKDLKSSIERTNAKDVHVASKTYKPSGLNCIRFMWFQLTGTTPKADRASSELVGICESGTDRHVRIQDAVTNMGNNGIDCEYVDVADYVRTHNLEENLNIVSKNGNETKLYHTSLNISFLCDGIIKYKGKYYILEIKTETANKFWDQKDVMKGHILQGTAYSLCLGIDKVLFLYENRDTCGKKAYMLEVTDDMRMDLVAKITTCDSCVASNTCPPKPVDITRSQCTYCNYADECKKYI